VRQFAVAAHDTSPGRKALALGSALRGAVDDGAGMQNLFERVEQHRFTAFHSERAELHRQHVAQLVDYQAWQLVAFGVNQAHGARFGAGQAQLAAPFHRCLEPRAQKLGVDMPVTLARQ